MLKSHKPPLSPSLQLNLEPVNYADFTVHKIVPPFEIYNPELARGESSSVFLARNRNTNEYLAIKMYSIAWVSVHADTRFKHEEAILDYIQHLNCTCKHYPKELQKTSKNYMYRPMELCIYGSLLSYINKGHIMSEADIKYLIINLVPHLAALHALKVIHESIHPKHILATKNASGSLVFYLSGFQNAQISKGSISKTSSAAPLSQPGEKPETDWESASFTAPEIAKSGDAHNEKVDVWSFGKTLYVLLTGLISQGGKGTAISKNLSSLISSCLEKDPDKRISFRDILKHDFLVKSSPYAIIEHTKKPNLSLKSTSRKDITIPEKKKIEDYEIDFKNMIAKGVFSKIYVGKDVKTGIHYAVKRYEKQVVEEHLYMEAIMEELENMKRVQDSPYHLGFKEAFKLDQSGTANSYLYIVLEKCEGTLEELLVRRKKETFTPTEFKLLIWDLAKGIQEIRKQGAKGPCGITPNKILYKQDHNGKLTDFLISNYGKAFAFCVAPFSGKKIIYLIKAQASGSPMNMEA